MPRIKPIKPFKKLTPKSPARQRRDLIKNLGKREVSQERIRIRVKEWEKDRADRGFPSK